MGLGARLSHLWNAWKDWNQNTQTRESAGGSMSFGLNPGRVRLNFANERSILASILTRLSMDCAGVELAHVKNDDEGRYLQDIKSGLHNCLTVEANIDQAARHFRQDIVMTLFDKGVAAIVPVDTTSTPINSNSYDVLTMRVGEVVGWYPENVRVQLYNEKTGLRQQIVLPKKMVAIVENPLYQVMNEPNSTLQRLIRKLNMLDAVDEVSASGKLDLIIQLPYVVKSESRQQQAENRRKQIESQLRGSTYGIAYTDGTEKITQLNRPSENNLLAQVQYLTEMLYTQLGLTAEIMNGTASETTMLNYLNRTVEPVVVAIVEAMRRTFLSKTARTQGQSIEYYRDPFSLIPMAEIAKIADQFARNEITTANEIRAFIGLKPSKDPKADMLQNANMPQKTTLRPDGTTVPTRQLAPSGSMQPTQPS